MDLCLCLPFRCFTSPTPTSFSADIVVNNPFFVARDHTLQERFLRVWWVDRKRSCHSSNEFLSTHAIPKHRASLRSLFQMAMNTSNGHFYSGSKLPNRWMLICLHQCFHFVVNLERPTGAMSVFDWKITITESGKPVLALAFFNNISAVNSTQLFPCFSCFLLFFEVIKQNMANMLFKILYVRITIASTKLDRIALTFFWFLGWVSITKHLTFMSRSHTNKRGQHHLLEKTQWLFEHP